jgi:hypothetical protein
MVDEANVPPHRWYQRQNHIRLPREDVSRAVIKAAGIAKIDAWISLLGGVSLSAYAVNNFEPALTFDFVNEYYRTGGTDTTFASAMTHSRASAATYVDSAGILQTSAINVPRRGHHIWNGTAWVNEGLLVEPTAATNLHTGTTQLDMGFDLFSGVTSSAWLGGPSGNGLVITTRATFDSHVFRKLLSVAASMPFTSAIYAEAGTHNFIQITANSLSTLCVNFDLSDGSSNVVEGASLLGYGAIPWGAGFIIWASYTTSSANNYPVFSLVPNINSTRAVTWTPDGTETVKIDTPQLEAGSVPTSYIPTAGATVTRAADILTVPYANLPWPTPNVIGPELVTNGTFDTDISGWTTSNATLGVVDGALSITRNAASAYARQDVTVEAGKSYEISITRLSTSPFTGTSTMRIGSSLTGTQYGQIVFTSSTDDEALSAVFSATGATAFLTIGWGMASDGDIVYHDNISVREIDPLSVSIQMDGRMTYADTSLGASSGGGGGEVNQFLWKSGTSNWIHAAIDTTGSRTGQALFAQRQTASGLDIVGSVTYYYSPAINVPFNIASRHGSTFINGAVDGTALTADLTPTALPDLSTTNLSLATSGGPMVISKFRIWANDLGDTGIAEASA